MERLIEGHRKFLGEVFPERRSHFHLLAESQAPEYLFITCSDSRDCAGHDSRDEPGDLFITRNAGTWCRFQGRMWMDARRRSNMRWRC